MILLAQLDGEYLNLFLAGIFGMFLLSISLVAFFVVYQRKLFAQERLRQEEERLHQKALLVAAVEVQESERRRIASDLHDDIGSLLSATRLYLRQITPEATPDRVGQISRQSLDIIDEMIQNTRRITHDLLPPALEKFGFQAAAEDLCERFDHADSLSVTFSATSDHRLVPRREIALYRVLQELLNNTMKHAGATEIEVAVDGTHELFSFRYKDNGRGFEMSTTKSKGLGLRNIESRISLVGGTLQTETGPGEGLKVIIDLPLTPTDA